MDLRYSVELRWSEEDKTFVVFLPEWADKYVMPCGDGPTYEEALQSARDALESYVGFAQQDGEELPVPRVYSVVEGDL